MARPVSTKATVKYRLSKAVIADVEELHWIVRKDVSDLVEDALIEYLAAHAPNPKK